MIGCSVVVVVLVLALAFLVVSLLFGGVGVAGAVVVMIGPILG